MLNIEYVRSLNCNYERILLDYMPEEHRYQYNILGRCQIRGLLPCSLRYIDGCSYLYYDISSKQNMALLYGTRCITREWVRDFIWSMKRIQQELGRFLLDIDNVLWYPEHVFQELEKNVFSFLYVPYYNGETGFKKLMEFWVEHIDYNDEGLVECIYRMYERLERNGEIYLHSQIFEDAECLEKTKMPELVCTVVEETVVEEVKEDVPVAVPATEGKLQIQGKSSKKGFRKLLEGKRNRGQKAREDYRQSMQRTMSDYAVTEKAPYEEAYGQTVYIEEKAELPQQPHRLLTPEGKLLVNLEQPVLSVGKKKEEVDLVLKDASVSRMHARIITQEGNVYLEDLNSTNGTFQNSQRLQPYEKRKLEEGDEIKFGKVFFIFR